MYGAQTCAVDISLCIPFENDVEMYGAQTGTEIQQSGRQFENDVEMYGARTATGFLLHYGCLRMMQKCMVPKHTLAMAYLPLVTETGHWNMRKWEKV